METINSKMIKIIFSSLLVAISSLVILYFLVYKMLINDQIQKARLAANSIIVMKLNQMVDGKGFDKIIKIFSKKTGINFEFNAVFNKNFDNSFFKELKNKKEFYRFENSKLLYYKPVYVEKECIKCHGGVKVNNLTGFKVGDFIGVLQAKIPVKQEIINFNKTFLYIFVVLLIALVFTLFCFYRYAEFIKFDIEAFFKYFSDKIKQGVYEPLKNKMHYMEFENLKNEINNAVEAIKFYKNEMLKKYLYNSITELPNRNKLTEDLNTNPPVALAILNINKFREVNDVFGTETGDKLIRQVAKRLKNIKNTYHINIDEFALFLDVDNKKDAFDMLKNIINCLEQPYNIDDLEISLTFRCGLSIDDDKLTTADIALDYSKKIKEKVVCFCDIKYMFYEYKNNLKMLNIIIKAIKNNNILLHYQPIIDNETLKPVKYEALVRIKDDNGKIYYPGEFLKLSKSANLYYEITLKVFEIALEKFRNKDIGVSLNLDLEDFENENVRNIIKKQIENFPDPSMITIEILESENVTNSKYAIQTLKYFKSLGVNIFIDDFGSGYSNFSYLFNFELDGFKIDGSLIKSILTDNKSELIVKTMIDFAKRGNMKVVGEFVENKDIYLKLKSLGVDYSQGYYFSKPLEDI